jgi:GT2 family glycosyltransferase
VRYQMRVLRHMLRQHEFDQQRWRARALAYKPTISVLTPVFNTPPDVLKSMLSSVRTQTYPYWELCLADDGSDERWIAAHLARRAESDPRIKFIKRAANGGIVAGSNAALAMATGEFIALLDHDDELAVEALYRIATLLNEHPEADMIYTDFDVRASDGILESAFFKPDWSPDYLHALPYTTHLTVYRTELVRAVGGFRQGLDGSQDYDLALRVTEVTDGIFHIPRVLYHWRVVPSSSASSANAKPYAYEAAKQAIGDYITRNRIDAEREEGPFPGAHHIRHNRSKMPPVSIVALAEPAGGLLTSAGGGRLVESMSNLVDEDQDADLEVVVVAAASMAERAASDLKKLGTRALQLVVVEDPVDVGRAWNAAAAVARGEHLVFLGEQLVTVGPEWVRQLLEYSAQDGIGAVGPKVHGAWRTVQHAGVVIPDGRPRRVHVGANRRSTGYFGNLQLPMNYSAVSGACLMTRRAVFEQLGGFEDAANVGYSDVDYCLRVRRAGYRIVYTPYAELRQLSTLPAKEDNDAGQVHLFRTRWETPGWTDPYYNPNFSSAEPLFTFSID